MIFSPFQKYTNYRRQLIEAEQWTRRVTEAIIRDAKARGAKVTVFMDEIVILEPEGMDRGEKDSHSGQ